jgi:uncharacterized protein (TIGR03437 family)
MHYTSLARKALLSLLVLFGLTGLGLAVNPPFPLIVKPGVLIFRQTGSVTPASQTLKVSSFTGTLGTLTVSTTGGSWLTATASGTTVTVAVNTTGLSSGKYSGAVAISASGYASTSVNVFLTVIGNNIVASPSTFNLTAMVGGEIDPRPHLINVYDQIGSHFSWTAAADQNWLVLQATSGMGKSILPFVVDPTKLTAAGSYTGHITVTDTTNSTTATVTVNLTATAAGPPDFTLGPYLKEPGILNFVADTNLSTVGPKIFYGRNLGGGGSLSFTLTGTVNSPAGGTWLSFTPSSNTTPGLTTVKVNPAGLQPGLYSATITGTAAAPAGLTGGVLTAQLTVYLRVLENPSIHLSARYVRFTSSTSQNPPSPSPASREVAFLTNSTTGYPFTAVAGTSLGGNWLSVLPTSGTAVDGGQITVSVSPTVIAGLSPGFYTGEVQVNFSGGSPNAQRVIGVGLRIYGPTASPQLVVNPGGLGFAVIVGGSNPASKNVNVRAEFAGSAGLPFTVSSAVSSPAGGTWLSAGITSGVATSTDTPVPINVNTAGLAVGQYAGTVTFTPDPASNVAVEIVNVNLIVAEAGAFKGSAVTSGSRLLTFAPGPLVATITSTPENFTGSTDSALNFTVQLTDSAGNPVTGATVVLHSSNGEPDVTLDDDFNGSYSGLFQPAEAGPVTLSVSAMASDSTGALFQAPSVAVSGDIESAADVAMPVFTNGAVSSASFAVQPTPLTPGSLVSVFGTNIAGSGGSATSVPLPGSLGGMSVTVGGITAPLISAIPASAPGGLDQINLQIPFQVDGQPDAEIVITNNGIVSAPQDVTLGIAPAFFTQNSSGTGDGSFVHTDGVTLITPSDPAKAGEVIVLYATGLGDVATAVATGSAATGPDNATGTVSVIIGGLPATVGYAGLAPSSVGEYQLNVTVPAGLPAGENNITMFVNGSPATGSATIALH